MHLFEFKSESANFTEGQVTFLNDLQLPWISEEDKHFDYILEESQILESILKLKKDKSSGPDDLPTDNLS